MVMSTTAEALLRTGDDGGVPRDQVWMPVQRPREPCGKELDESGLPKKLPIRLRRLYKMLRCVEQAVKSGGDTVYQAALRRRRSLVNLYGVHDIYVYIHIHVYTYIHIYIYRPRHIYTYTYIYSYIHISSIHIYILKNLRRVIASPLPIFRHCHNLACI